MAIKSNNAGQIISIPQGGGALHSIGETFWPDLHITDALIKLHQLDLSSVMSRDLCA
jgi:hypothetical protein